MVKKDLYYIFLILFFSFLGIKSLIHSGFYTSHDGRHQVIRLMHFHQGLKDGQFPVRWAGTAFGGYGYPLFIFSYRLPFWIAEGSYLISHSLTKAIKITFILTYLFSGITMYWFAKNLWSSKLSGFISAFLYLWAPYRFSNIFVRASLGEATTFMFIPLFFLSVFKLRLMIKKNKYFLLLGILSLSGILLSHFIILIIWLLPFFFWVLVNWLLTKEKKKYFLKIILISVITILLTCYYWLPAKLEKKFTIFDNTINNYYENHFVAIKQLLYSKWGYGFNFGGTENDMMSFQIGISQWLIIILILILLGKKFLQDKTNFIKKHWQYFYFFFIFIFSIFLMIKLSSFIYQNFKNIMAIDIPWRFLGVTIFSSSILSGGVLKLIKGSLQKTLLACIIVIALYTNRNHLKVNQYLYYQDSEYFQDQETSNEHDDYAPKWFIKPFWAKEIEIQPISGKSKNQLIKRNSCYFSFFSEVESQEAEIGVRLAYYPGWKTFVNKIERETIEKDGKIKVHLKKGNNLVEFIFTNTKLRIFSNTISLLTLLLIIIICVKKEKNG